jgi:hypothetical protein
MFDTPATYEALAAAGSGLGAAGFLVFDDSTDLVAVAHGVAQFLAVESCGQCEPCKRDGLAIAAELDALQRSSTDAEVIARLEDRLTTITDGARCNLATQQQIVTRSLLERFPDLVEAHVHGASSAADPVVVAPILDIVDGHVVLDEAQSTKQPDWSHDPVDSARWPAAYLADTSVQVGSRVKAAAPVDSNGRPVEIDVAAQLERAIHEAHQV